MAGDPLRKVKAGEPLSISARAYNTIVDAVQYVQNNRNDFRGDTPLTVVPDGCVLIKASADLAQFQPISISGPIFGPNTSDAVKFANWKNNDLIFSTSTAVPGSENQFGIVQEPLKSGKIGVARVRGYSRVQVNVTNASYNQYATVKSGTTDKLVAQSWGPCRVHYYESGGTGVKWAVVDLHSDRYLRIAGKPNTSLSSGGSATLNVHVGTTSTGETCTIVDANGLIGSTALTTTQMLYGWYDCQTQQAILSGWKCP